ncbi:MAG: cytochrome P450 [Actinomycetota bacterium]
MAPDGSVQRVTSTTGEAAWLVSGYGRVRELLADARLSRTHPEPKHPARMTQIGVFGGPIGSPEGEEADHLRLRRLLARPFSPRRMEALRPRVQALVDELLAAMRDSGSPADLHHALSHPLPALVICELLGIPPDDREGFRRWAFEATQAHHPARARAGLQSLWRYLGALVERKRWAPGEDVVSDLLAAAADPTLTDDGIAHLAAGMLFAGHQTAVSIIDRGVLLLLANPEQRQALQQDPALVPRAVEEILRCPSPVEPQRAHRRGGLPKYAATDITVAGVTIRRGDLVLFALEDANQDAATFSQPGDFDIARPDNPHLAFSHGLHFCLGAPLARMELQCLFGTLFSTFPTLALAVPIGTIRPVPDRVAGAVMELPVTW